jgi:hypothetical protein
MIHKRNGFARKASAACAAYAVNIRFWNVGHFEINNET